MLLVLAGGCRQEKKTPPPDWQKSLPDISLKRDIHDKSARELAERGFRETAPGSVLNYRYRMLVAEAEVCDANPQHTGNLLAVLPTSSPDYKALEAKRQYILAVLENCLGHRVAAEAHLATAEQLAQTSIPELLAKIYFRKGWIENAKKDKAKEEEYQKEALRLAQQYPQPIEASVLTSLGLLYLGSHRYSAAVEMFVSSLKSARKWHDRRLEELSLGNLGDLYLELGDYRLSEEYSKPGAEMAAALGEEDHELAWLLNLGSADQSDPRQLFDDAEAAFLRALELAKKLGDNGSVIKCLNNLAHLSIRRGDIPKAKDFVRQVEILDPKQGAVLYFLRLHETEIALAERDYPRAQKLAERALHLSPAPNALNLQRFQTDLARAYAGQSKDILAERWFRTAINTAEKVCADVKEDAFRITCLGQSTYYADYVAFLVKKNRPLEAMAVAELGRSRILGDGASAITPEKAAAKIKLVQNKLRPGKQVILTYFLCDDQSYLWAVTHSNITAFVLPPIKVFYSEIYSYNQQIQALQNLGDSQTAVQLYEQLVLPAQSLIPRGAQVTIVPNRNLYHLNFETLVVPGPSPHYWIEDVEINVSGSFSILATPSRPRQATSSQLLLIGDPKQVPGGPPPLAHAAEEMQRVTGHFALKQRAVIAGDSAIPQSYSSSHPAKFRYIHFATHGIASLISPLDSYILLSPGADGHFELPARSIMTRKISAELVTISACESGGVRAFDSEGLIGLGWAFMHAGAHEVVAGLWDVDDASSPRLMDDFYAGITSGMDAAHSLREAKLKMLHGEGARQRPYYWGPLQLHVGP